MAMREAELTRNYAKYTGAREVRTSPYEVYKETVKPSIPVPYVMLIRKWPVEIPI